MANYFQKSLVKNSFVPLVRHKFLSYP